MIVIGLLLLLVLGYLVLQSPWIQNRLIQSILSSAATDLQTEIKLKRVDLSLFDQVSLEGFLIRDLKGDTLLSVAHLNAGLQSNILTLAWKKLEIDHVNLRGVRINVQRLAGEEQNNAHFVLNYLDPPKPPSPNKPRSDFFLHLKNASIKDVRFNLVDEVIGQDISGNLNQLEVRINLYNKKEQFLDLAYIETSGLDLDFSETERHPLPEKVHPVHAAPSDTSIKKPPFHFRLGELSLEHNHFWYNNKKKSPKADPTRETVDFDHLDLDRLNLYIRDIVGNSDEGLRGVLKEISAREYSGFELSMLSADTLRVTGNSFSLDNMRLRTPNTDLGNQFRMDFDGLDALKNFTDEVKMSLTIAPNKHIGLRDIQYFSPPLMRNAFFQKNAQKLVSIEGTLYGKVNRLRGRDLRIALDQDTYLKGRFVLDNAEATDQPMILNVVFDELKTSVSALRQLIPGFSPPDNFSKLGRLSYVGRYDLIYGTQHIAKGDLKTNLGPASLDMELDLAGGKNAAQYSGKLGLQDFDLGTWMGDSQFGKTSLDIRIDTGSRGLVLKTLDAKVVGSLNSLDFKGYKYKNVQFGGLFSNQIFDGFVRTSEKDLALDFNGLVNMKDSIPIFNFKMDIVRADLFQLGLTKVPLSLRGSVERFQMTGRNLQEAQGEGLIRGLSYRYQSDMEQTIDSVFLQKQRKANGESYVLLKSSVASAILDGNFDLTTMQKTVQSVLGRNYQRFARKLGIKEYADFSPSSRMDFNLDIHDTKNLVQIFIPGLDTIRNVSIKGRVDGAQNMLQLEADIPSVKYAGIKFERAALSLLSQGSQGNWNLDIGNTVVSPKLSLAPIEISGKIVNDRLDFSIENQTSNSVLKQIKLDGSLTALDSAWQVKFDPSNIALLNDHWTILEDNYVRFGKGYFETQNFELKSGDKRIRLNNLGKQGVNLAMTNFNLNFLDNILKVRDIRYSGKIYDFDINIQNVLKMEGIEVFLNTDTLFIRDRPYGFITGNLEMKTLDDPLEWKISMVDGKYRMQTLGAYIPKGKSAKLVEGLGLVPSDGFKSKVEADKFPFDLLSQFIPGISKLSGDFNIDATVGGKLAQIGMNGYLNINQGAFQLDYLKTMFHIKNQRIYLTDDKVWADGDTIYDASTEQYGLVSGGLRHQYFKKWTLDVGLKSVGDRFMILNTTERDNPVYYGQGIGRAEARFTGDFVRTNIDVIATAMRDSRLYLPIDSYVDAGDVSFIKFVNPNEKKDSTKVKALNPDFLKGTQFSIDLGISRDAVVQMIIDKRAGDNVTGRGVGDISIKYDRTGKLNMYGQYEIEQGEYLFTLLNIFNKPFKVVKGGTINWYGDPYTAQVNLTASYDENTPIATLIQSELAAQPNENLANQARVPTAINLNLKLSGNLFKPDISFDIVAPNLTGELKSLVDNKLRTLRLDQNELNRQVFGIVVVGTFLPDGEGGLISNTDYLATTAVNSVTQLLSSQLSGFLSTIARDWLGGKVSSIDLNIAYNDITNSSLSAGGASSTTGRELQVQLNSGFIDNRLRVQVGSQIGYNNITGTSQGNFVGGDVQLYWNITKNGQWRMKAYNRLEPAYVSGTRQNRLGSGLSFSRDYDSFTHMMSGLTDYFSKFKK
jgi:TamB, inner membrane protein subunit of TAM complex